MAVQKVKELKLLEVDLPADQKEIFDKALAAWGENVWVEGAMHLAIVAVVGCCVLALSRHFLSTRNLKICCFADYCCGCCECFFGLMGIVGFFVLIFIGAGLSDTAATCSSWGNTIVLQDGQTIQVTTTIGVTGTSQPTVGFVNCERAVEIFRDLCYIFAFDLGVVGIISCCLGGTCFVGGKFAKDTQDIFDGEGGYGYDSGYY
jgi:hypothetical protein